MSKLKIEHGASKINWVLLKTNIEESIAKDIDLMCQWSENDRKYIVNELLRFALAESAEFQKHKAESQLSPARTAKDTNSLATGTKPAPDTATKAAMPIPTATHLNPSGATK